MQPKYNSTIFFIANPGPAALIGDIMTKKTKEAIKASAAIVLVVVAILTFWIYPLNQAGKIIARPDTESTVVDPAEFGLVFDSLSFVTEDNINLTGMFLTAAPQEADTAMSADTSRGMVILIHGLFDDGLSQMKKAASLIEAGFQVIAYDQRAYGKSEGNYRSGGYYEGNDLQEVIYSLNLEDRLIHPLIVWGEEHGANAALHAWENDNRIDYVIAENPVVDGRDWQKRIRDHDGRTAPNFMMGIIWWWMKQKSGYEFSVESVDISDAYGSAIVNHSGRIFTITCGSDEVPDNVYIAELKEMGGEWMVLPCPEEETLFDSHQQEIMADILNMIQ